MSNPINRRFEDKLVDGQTKICQDFLSIEVQFGTDLIVQVDLILLLGDISVDRKCSQICGKSWDSTFTYLDIENTLLFKIEFA